MTPPRNPIAWQPRARLKGEALPNTIGFSSDNYDPAKHNPPAPTRPGALDFLTKPSRGYRT